MDPEPKYEIRPRPPQLRSADPVITTDDLDADAEARDNWNRKNGDRPPVDFDLPAQPPVDYDEINRQIDEQLKFIDELLMEKEPANGK
jgi:hypothetical protein